MDLWNIIYDINFRFEKVSLEKKPHGRMVHVIDTRCLLYSTYLYLFNGYKYYRYTT